MDFNVAISSITKGLEVLRAMREIDKNFDAATYKMKIVDLMEALADAKQGLVDARDGSAVLQAEINRLKESFRERADDTVVVRGFRYKKGPQGKPMGMPYCSRCEKVDGLLINLAGTRGKDHYKASCPQCKADFGPEHGYVYPDGEPSALAG